MAVRPPFEDESNPTDNVVQVDFSRAASRDIDVPDLDIESNSQKQKVFGDLLEQGVTMVILDARCEGVLVPPDFADELDLRLNFSHRYGLKDFVYGEQGVEATLSFAQGLYFCRLPWYAVFAIQSEALKSGAIWPEDVPPELQTQLKPVPVPTVKKKRSKSSKSTPVLRLVTDE